MTTVLTLLWMLGCGSPSSGPGWAQPPGAPAWAPEVVEAVGKAVEAGDEPWANRLALESSPYLLQHATNPVDWQPWSDAAFEQAAREDKPVLLSIGYSTCHWCHVMERESFEDEEVARRINEHFVAIKVDRETRPDVDAVYLRATQALIGNAGWPLTLVLTPEREVFFAGTYLPARTGDRGGKTGLYEVLGELSGRWEKDRDNLITHAKEVSRRIDVMARPPAPTAIPELAVLSDASARMAATFDTRFGGFGRPPRFPNPTELQFLLREHRRTGDPATLELATRTLDAILEGGLRDHLGGGFHRYCVDADWTVPHFEKMVTDQAQLATLFVEAWQVTGEERYRLAARDTLDFAIREMRDEQGGFWTAIDADSPGPDGPAEGRFYTWTADEIRAAAGDDAALALAWYGVDDQADLEDGRSVLTARNERTRFAKTHGLTLEQLDEAVTRIRRTLYQARKDRPRPATDDKVVLGHNALMVSALAKAHFAFDEPVYGHAARRAARFAARNMAGPEGSFRRSWRHGTAEHAAVLEDHALMARAWLDLFEATGEADWLGLAERAAESMQTHFGDEAGGWYETAHSAEGLLTRGKPWTDGALPGPNAVATEVSLRLFQLTGKPAYQARADGALTLFGEPITLRGGAGSTMLGAVAFRRSLPRQIVLTQGTGHDEMREVLRTSFRPNSVLVPLPDAGAISLGQVPWLQGKIPLDGAATLYVCQDGLCKLPVTTPQAAREQLADLGR